MNENEISDNEKQIGLQQVTALEETNGLQGAARRRIANILLAWEGRDVLVRFERDEEAISLPGRLERVGQNVLPYDASDDKQWAELYWKVVLAGPPLTEIHFTYRAVNELTYRSRQNWLTIDL